ncbi:MAG: hypothetical protein BGP11_16105 [Rhodobacterales bacterium 65-51]|uniref:hypothetical protein n=1 Tax=uncultured Gemmobacter sp. TaxID=1095917 RepID=UPI00096363CA|nr:hypothetical protein [uncultured Gemmobacter sp.]OJY34631.1 MAG: hypothetical protein BGP11_16105 [Rhodobacterales bacterium 65-51]
MNGLPANLKRDAVARCASEIIAYTGAWRFHKRMDRCGLFETSDQWAQNAILTQVRDLAAIFGYRLERIDGTVVPVTPGILPGTTVGAPHD